MAKGLHTAKTAKKDEFYTQLSDIEKELKHYRNHFKGKVVFCNCDDPRVSNFFHYFSYNFEKLGLKKLIATCYKNQDADLFSQNDSERAVYLEYTGDKNGDSVPNPDEIGSNRTWKRSLEIRLAFLGCDKKMDYEKRICRSGRTLTSLGNYTS